MDQQTLKKTVEVVKTNNLIDLNGTKTNFSSDIFVKSKRPIDLYAVAVASQSDLEKDAVTFVSCDANGEFRHHFTVKDNTYNNYYLVLKKLKSDTSFAPIMCDVVATLTEIGLTPIKQQKKVTFADTTPQPAHQLDAHQLDAHQQIQKGGLNSYHLVGLVCFLALVYIMLTRAKAK